MNTEQKITKIVDGDTPSIEASVKQLGATGALAVSISDGSGNIMEIESDPLIKYKSADRDIEGATKYLGYTDVDGNWVIRKDTITAVRYAFGTSDYPTNWTNRASLTYDYLYNAI